MAVREARFVDIPGIISVLKDAFERSIYADATTYDETQMKQILVQSIQRHGHKNYGGTLVLVSETEGEVRGVLVGLLDQVYPAVKALMATDIFFVMTEKADGRDAHAMLKQFMEWAEASPKVIEIHLGVTNAIGDWERTAKLYRRVGLEQCGAMFRREVVK